MKISEDKTSVEYTIPDNMTVFNILNIPLKMSKDEVKKTIELINLQYNRLYKRGFYWVLSTVEKETVICIQNSLRDLSFEDSKVKYDLSNRSQIFRAMKEQIEKSSYQKEAKNLGISNSGGNSKNFGKKKGSDDAPDAFILESLQIGRDTLMGANGLAVEPPYLSAGRVLWMVETEGQRSLCR